MAGKTESMKDEGRFGSKREPNLGQKEAAQDKKSESELGNKMGRSAQSGEEQPNKH